MSSINNNNNQGHTISNSLNTMDQITIKTQVTIVPDLDDGIIENGNGSAVYEIYLRVDNVTPYLDYPDNPCKRESQLIELVEDRLEDSNYFDVYEYDKLLSVDVVTLQSYFPGHEFRVFSALFVADRLYYKYVVQLKERT